MRREGDVVLIYFDEQPGVFARIEAIKPDIKKDWYQITLLLLTLPLRPVTWILRESYIDGESFTMDGKPVRLEEVTTIPTTRDSSAAGEGDAGSRSGKRAKIFPFKKP